MKNRYRNKTQRKGCGQRIAEVASGVTVYQLKVRRDAFLRRGHSEEMSGNCITYY